MPEWLTTVAWVSLVLGGLSALVILGIFSPGTGSTWR